MTPDTVQAWLDRYIAAWRANDAGMIGDLFTDDAAYSFRPWVDDRETIRGRDAIVAAWLEDPDEPGSWAAAYEPFAVDGDRAVAVGWSTYVGTGDAAEDRYHNVFLLEFGPDGRCRSFRDSYMNVTG